MWKRLSGKKLKKMMRQFPCVGILGARQVGKTTLAKITFPKAKYYDLESPSLRDRIALDPEEFLKNNPPVVILDEAQIVPEIFQALKVIIDESREINGRFLLLGSANPLLMREVSETLAGRIGILDLDPMTNRESLTANPKLTLTESWLRGGYPPAAKYKHNEARIKWLESYLRTFIERDLPFYKFDVHPDTMRKIIHMISHVHCGLWNASQLASSIGITYHTVNRYLGILETAFIVRLLKPYFVNIGKRLTKAPKVLIRDSGFLHYLLGIYSAEDLLNSPYCGNSWEGFIIEEIIRFCNSNFLAPDYYYYRTHAGLEADLILSKRNKLLPIEIKFSGRIQKQWLNNMNNLLLDLKTNKGAIIYSGKESFKIDKGIEVVSAQESDFQDKIFKLIA